MVTVGADISGFQGGMGRIQDDTNNLGSRLSAGLSQAGAGLSRLGAGLTGIGGPFAALWAAAVKAFSDSQAGSAPLDAGLKIHQRNMTNNSPNAGAPFQ